MERWPMPDFKVVPIEVISVICYLPYLVANLCEFCIIIPRLHRLGSLLLRLRLVLSLYTVKDSTIHDLLIVLLSLKVALDRKLILLCT